MSSNGVKLLQRANKLSMRAPRVDQLFTAIRQRRNRGCNVGSAELHGRGAAQDRVTPRGAELPTDIREEQDRHHVLVEGTKQANVGQLSGAVERDRKTPPRPQAWVVESSLASRFCDHPAGAPDPWPASWTDPSKILRHHGRAPGNRYSSAIRHFQNRLLNCKRFAACWKTAECGPSNPSCEFPPRWA